MIFVSCTPIFFSRTESRKAMARPQELLGREEGGRAALARKERDFSPFWGDPDFQRVCTP